MVHGETDRARLLSLKPRIEFLLGRQIHSGEVVLDTLEELVEKYERAALS